MKPQEIQNIILQAAEETNSQLAAAIREHGDKTKLFGRDALLDSLALVSLIAAVESRLREQSENEVMLVNEDAMSRQHSPFRTVGALRDYIEELLASSGCIGGIS